MSSPPSNQATLVGCVSLICWAFGSVMLASLTSIPTFEIVAITMAVSFGFSLVRIALLRRWSVFRQPWYVWLLGVIGIVGQFCCLNAAMKYAPPAQVDLINHTWPIMLILSMSIMQKESLQLRDVIGCLLGFAGLCCLVLHKGMAFFSSSSFLGYGFAFMGASAWVSYSLCLKRNQHIPLETIGIFCGVGALLALIGHRAFEETIIPTASQSARLITLGFFTQCLAYYCWHYGVTYGNVKSLSVLSYLSPLLSVSLLVFFGFTEPHMRIFIAAILIVIASFIISSPYSLKEAFQLFYGRLLLANSTHRDAKIYYSSYKGQ